MVSICLQNKMSAHRKFCTKMPIKMWLARQRATSRAYSETDEGQPCKHCGWKKSEAHAKARHENQCGDRFDVLGMRQHQGNFISTTWADTGLREETELKYAKKNPGTVQAMTHLLQYSLLQIRNTAPTVPDVSLISQLLATNHSNCIFCHSLLSHGVRGRLRFTSKCT